ncbi:histidine phosphatase family protein [Algibacillus agarilyticus]|uniref:histidine phosphatase family protein n=1 Tax=Algibacillus agarilyticus TaxID=2234133 RepID=UPI001300B3C2|nr:histidine phosphatase family protein [Algibacillus agarilyticus]
MQTTLYLARHGETDWNKQQRLQGQLNSELTKQGIAQSIALANHLQSKKITTIVSSPLGRAVITAQHCERILNIPWVSNLALVERDFGDWQGQMLTELSANAHYTEILQQYTHAQPPNGESAITCGQRIYQGLLTLAQAYLNQHILVIFHGEALRCFMNYAGWPTQQNAYQLFANANVLAITYSPTKPYFEQVTP